MSFIHACNVPFMLPHPECTMHLHVRAVTARLQVLPYWTKASLQNLAAVVCWRHAASLNPASIRVTQSADGSQDADQELSTAFSCPRTPEKIVPLEVITASHASTLQYVQSLPQAPAAACTRQHSYKMVIVLIKTLYSLKELVLMCAAH